PYIQKQAILTELRRIVGIDTVRRPGWLEATGAEVARIADSRPSPRRDRRSPAPLPNRRLGIRNALEGPYTVNVSAPHQLALRQRQDRLPRVCGSCDCGVRWLR